MRYGGATFFRRRAPAPSPLRAGAGARRRGCRLPNIYYVELRPALAAAGGVGCSVAAGAASYRPRRAGARYGYRRSTIARPPCVLGKPPRARPPKGGGEGAAALPRARHVRRKRRTAKPLLCSCLPHSR